MSNYSISCLFPFRRVKFTNFGQITNNKGETAVILETEPDLRFNPICHECGCEAEGIHSWHRRPLKDLPFGSTPVTIFYNYRKIKCPECGAIKVEQLNITDAGGPKITNRMAQYIYDLCEIMTVDEVASHLNLDPSTIRTVEREFLEKEFGETDYSHSGYLAVDEISIGKHHQYMTVVLDFNTGRVLWVGKDRKAETLNKFFQNMPGEKRDQVEAFAMDMWDPYIKSVKEWCPQASIVFDKYHIISDFNNTIDKVRRREQNKKSLSTQQQKVIKGSRWLLLKNQENLKKENKADLDKLLKLNQNLLKVYILKDELNLIWKNHENDPEQMEKALNYWCEKALRTNLKPVIKFVKRLQDHKEGIIAYAKHQIHTSKLEGVNNKIKEIKRSAYGFHDKEYFKLKIKRAFPGN
ncbi:MAG: ISL3 family transposase [Bacillota bacterium]